MANKIIIYSDGGARGNPGPAGIGAVLLNDAGSEIGRISQFIGTATNNQAEYKALIAALEIAVSLGGEQIICFLDSELVVRQLQGKYKVREAGLKPLMEQMLRLTAKFKSIEFNHVPREKNTLADQLVNDALDKSGN